MRNAAVDVTVIDRRNHHLLQPLPYQMATGILAEGDIAPAIRDILQPKATPAWRLEKWMESTSTRAGSPYALRHDPQLEPTPPTSDRHRD